MAHFDLSVQDSRRQVSVAFEEVLAAVRFVQSRLALVRAGQLGDRRWIAGAKQQERPSERNEADLAHRLGLLAVETALRG